MVERNKSIWKNGYLMLLLNYVPWKCICQSPKPQDLRMWLSLETVADEVNLIRVGPNPRQLVSFIKKGNVDTDARTQGETTWKQRLGWCSHKPKHPKNCQQTIRTRRKAQSKFSLPAHGRNQPCRHHDLRHPASTTGKEQIPVAVTPPPPPRPWYFVKGP